MLASTESKRVLQALLDDGLSRGLYSGAAAGIQTPSGSELVYAGSLAFDDPAPVRDSSLFDLASVSKTVTAAVLVRMAQAGALDLDAPVREHVAVGRGENATAITARMLLLHVAGLPAESFLWRDLSVPRGDRLDRVLSEPLETAPGDVHRYSCVGYIAAGALAARAANMAWPDLVKLHVTQQLSLTSMGYGPVDARDAVATEEQPWVDRGLVRGEVHDELSWYLGGAVGNAGLFATARDVLQFASALVEGPFLDPDGRKSMTENGIEARHGAAYGQALGPRISDSDFMGELGAIGHPGFTGTMWIAFPEARGAAVLLTNRVHPSRNRVDLSPFRRRFSTVVGELLAG